MMMEYRISALLQRLLAERLDALRNAGSDERGVAMIDAFVYLSILIVVVIAATGRLGDFINELVDTITGG